MARVELPELVPGITDVLLAASTGKGTDRGFLTAYQILKRLPPAVQGRLEVEYGEHSGKGAEVEFSPASRVAQAASRVPNVQQRYLDTGGLQFDIGTEDVGAGGNLCAIFRLP